jgi:hypothetical protein
MKSTKLSTWDVAYALVMSIASAISYWIVRDFLLDHDSCAYLNSRQKC